MSRHVKALGVGRRLILRNGLAAIIKHDNGEYDGFAFESPDTER